MFFIESCTREDEGLGRNGTTSELNAMRAARGCAESRGISDSLNGDVRVRRHIPKVGQPLKTVGILLQIVGLLLHFTSKVVTLRTNMQAFRSIFVILPLVLTAGALLLLLLTVLSGASTSSPLNKFWYLRAAISSTGTTSPDGMLHWTNYNFCGSQNGNNVNCGSKHAAYGFAPASQLTDPSPALPTEAVAHNSRSRITSRTYYAFLLISLFFTFIAMVMCLAGFFGRLGAAIGLVASFIAWVMVTVAASLMTVVYVRGRNYFRSGGISSNVGVKLFAFMWAAMAALLLALIIFAVGVCIPGEGSRRSRRRKTASYQEKPLVADNESFVPVQAAEPTYVSTTYAEPSYVVPVAAEPATSVYTDVPRSSYERVSRSAVAPPIDGMHTTADSGFESTGTGATYLR